MFVRRGLLRLHRSLCQELCRRYRWKSGVKVDRLSWVIQKTRKKCWEGLQSAFGGPLQASLTCQTHWVGNRMRCDCSSAETTGLVWIPRWCEPHSHPCWPEGTRLEERSFYTEGLLGPVSGSLPRPPCFHWRTRRHHRPVYLLSFDIPRRWRQGKETCCLPCDELPFAFGSRSASKEKRKRGGKKEPYEKMECNFHGHSLTTRFLLTALPKHFYTGERESIFQSLLDLAASEAEYMFYVGVKDTRTGRGKVNAVLLHISGDWPFLADSGCFLRSFRNVQKRKTRKSLPNGICHLCAAGTMGWDFEQINSRKPRWLQSMHDPSLPLFAEGSPTPFYRVHPAKNIGALWAYDLFHTFHLGVARCFLGSCIVLLSELESESAVDDRFSSLSSGYISWRKSRKKRSFITKLTKEHIQWPTTTSYPSGGWHKGGLSTVLMEWMQDRYNREGASWNACNCWWSCGISESVLSYPLQRGSMAAAWKGHRSGRVVFWFLEEVRISCINSLGFRPTALDLATEAPCAAPHLLGFVTRWLPWIYFEPVVCEHPTGRRLYRTTIATCTPCNGTGAGCTSSDFAADASNL